MYTLQVDKSSLYYRFAVYTVVSTRYLTKQERNYDFERITTVKNRCDLSIPQADKNHCKELTAIYPQKSSPRPYNSTLTYPKANAEKPKKTSLLKMAFKVSFRAASNRLFNVSVVLPRGNSTKGWSTCKNLHSGSQPSLT
jgi:hypothetical protein